MWHATAAAACWHTLRSVRRCSRSEGRPRHLLRRVDAVCELLCRIRCQLHMWSRCLRNQPSTHPFDACHEAISPSESEDTNSRRTTLREWTSLSTSTVTHSLYLPPAAEGQASEKHFGLVLQWRSVTSSIKYSFLKEGSSNKCLNEGRICHLKPLARTVLFTSPPENSEGTRRNAVVVTQVLHHMPRRFVHSCRFRQAWSTSKMNM